MQAHGFQIAIDEFGAGFSSLTVLRELPLDTLKIDRSHIKGLPEELRSCEIVAAVSAMARKLGLRIIVTGLEHSAQAEYV
jgi:sensor c-di-GMP phosphodiesterase-like protein